MTEDVIDLTTLFDLMDDADDALDKDTYEQIVRAEFDPPDDAELWIRSGTHTKCQKVFREIDRIRRALTLVGD